MENQLCTNNTACIYTWASNTCPTLTSISPNFGPSNYGGTSYITITVTGTLFINTTDYYCRFGTYGYQYSATYVNSNTVTCALPNYPDGAVDIDIIYQGNVYNKEPQLFTFVTCPTEQSCATCSLVSIPGFSNICGWCLEDNICELQVNCTYLNGHTWAITGGNSPVDICPALNKVSPSSGDVKYVLLS